MFLNDSFAQNEDKKKKLNRTNSKPFAVKKIKLESKLTL
jgi:hypothetical protein